MQDPEKTGSKPASGSYLGAMSLYNRKKRCAGQGATD
jgi:hypothetical protein